MPRRPPSVDTSGSRLTGQHDFSGEDWSEPPVERGQRRAPPPDHRWDEADPAADRGPVTDRPGTWFDDPGELFDDIDYYAPPSSGSQRVVGPPGEHLTGSQRAVVSGERSMGGRRAVRPGEHVSGSHRVVPPDEHVSGSHRAVGPDGHPSGSYERIRPEGPGTGQHEAISGDDEAYDDFFGDDVDEELLDGASAATRNALEWAVVLVGAVLVALALRALVFQAFFIPSESMQTTLMVDDKVLVNKVSYRLHDINRGDVVVFVREDDDDADTRDLIKRVIGLPGETVECRDNSIYINGNRLVEPYLDEGIITQDFDPVVVPEGHMFVMGDNRSNSTDSRVFGPVDENRVVGRAFVLFWPLNRIGSL